MSEWQPIETAPRDGTVIITKISDENGERNFQPLLNDGNSLWYFPDRSMYCYYRPTHWRPMPATEATPAPPAAQD